MRLLLVAEDIRLAGVLRACAGPLGATVHWVISTDDAELALRSGQYNCVLLEFGAADEDGEEVLRRMRLTSIELPLMIVTVEGRIDDRIRLLDLGADDLIVKPVHPGELLARLRALLRRCRGPDRHEAALVHGGLRAVPESRTVSRNGRFVPVTVKEFWVLEALLRSKGRVLPRRRLEEALRGDDSEIGGNRLEVHVHHLRRKLGHDVIRTVRGVGYRLGGEA